MSRFKFYIFSHVDAKITRGKKFRVRENAIIVSKFSVLSKLFIMMMSSFKHGITYTENITGKC